ETGPLYSSPKTRAKNRADSSLSRAGTIVWSRWMVIRHLPEVRAKEMSPLAAIDKHRRVAGDPPDVPGAQGARSVGHQPRGERGHDQRQAEKAHVDADQEADRPGRRTRPAGPDQIGQQQIDQAAEQDPSPTRHVLAEFDREHDRGNALEQEE